MAIARETDQQVAANPGATEADQAVARQPSLKSSSFSHLFGVIYSPRFPIGPLDTHRIITGLTADGHRLITRVVVGYDSAAPWIGLSRITELVGDVNWFGSKRWGQQKIVDGVNRALDIAFSGSDTNFAESAKEKYQQKLDMEIEGRPQPKKVPRQKISTTRQALKD